MNYERSNWHIRRKQAERQSGDVGYCPESDRADYPPERSRRAGSGKSDRPLTPLRASAI